MNQATQQKIVKVVNPAAIVDNASFTVSEIDARGWDYVQVVCHFGAMDVAMSAFKMQESDTSGSGHADISGLDYSVNGTLPSATDDNKFFAFNIDMRGRKPFLKLVATGGDGSSGTYMSAFALLSRGKTIPSTAAGRGFAAELSV